MPPGAMPVSQNLLGTAMGHTAYGATKPPNAVATVAGSIIKSTLIGGAIGAAVGAIPFLPPGMMLGGAIGAAIGAVIGTVQGVSRYRANSATFNTLHTHAQHQQQAVVQAQAQAVGRAIDQG